MAKGSQAKIEVEKKIIEAFGDKYLGTEDKKIYVLADDGGWVEDPGEMICQHCFDEYTSSCYYCGENYYTDDMVYDRKQEGYICKYCREENGIDIQEEEE